MPVEVSERALHDAVAVLAEQRLDGRQAAEAALDWLGWEREGPLHLRRYDVQLFAWYVLPRKFLAPLEDKREAAAAVARMLESIGGRAATYAEVCRAPQTDDLLCAWEAEDPRAWRSFRKLLEDSGIEPPDTDLLTCGQTMGPCEALARERVSIALEEAHEAGRLRPGAAGSRRGQNLVAIAALSEPWEEGGAVTCLQAVQAERLERWRDPRLTRSSERSAMLESVAALVAIEPAVIGPEGTAAAAAPARWLLERAEGGIALTQTGALNRALVREFVTSWPGWWDGRFGPPNREDDVAQLHELHALLRELRLVRRAGRKIVITKRGRELAREPERLLVMLAEELLRGDDFMAMCAELAGALILAGAGPFHADALAGRMHPAIMQQGWRSEAGPVSRHEVVWTVSDVLRAADAIGVVAQAPHASDRMRSGYELTEPGHVGLVAGLRARGLAPQ